MAAEISFDAGGKGCRVHIRIQDEGGTRIEFEGERPTFYLEELEQLIRILVQAREYMLKPKEEESGQPDEEHPEEGTQYPGL